MNMNQFWRSGVIGALIAVAYAPVAQASASVTPDASALSMVNTLLAANSGLSVVAGSAQYTGQASASGTFTNGGTGASGLGIDSGVVLTTGDARFIGSSAAFAGDDANKSGTYTAGINNALTTNTSAGNALFNSMTPFGNTNASVLSFQFVPQSSVMTVGFVFASEDYNDLVNAGFPTDVFGIFVNGINQALVPGSGLAISAATINCGGSSNGPSTGVGASNCGLYRDNAPFFGAIDSELDGMTVKLSFSMQVNAGQVNSVSFGIADAFDSSGDSALLLAAGSVSAVPEPATYALMLSGLVIAGAVARRRRSQPAGIQAPNFTP